ncbi:MAG: hypothetical protein ABGX16_11640 [Pirellulales bacterium]
MQWTTIPGPSHAMAQWTVRNWRVTMGGGMLLLLVGCSDATTRVKTPKQDPKQDPGQAVATLDQSGKANFFTEAFNGPNLPASFETAPLPSAQNAIFSGSDVSFLGVTRGYMRTVGANYFGIDFVAEITVTISAGAPGVGLHSSGFIGLGQGNSGNWGEPDQIPTIYMRVTPDPEPTDTDPEFSEVQVIINACSHRAGGAEQSLLYDGETTLVDDGGTSADNEGLIRIGDGSHEIGNGTHRLRMAWDAEARAATFSVDADYTGETFSADFTSVPVPYVKGKVYGGLDNKNAHIFFGGAEGVKFDDFSIVPGGGAEPDSDADSG